MADYGTFLRSQSMLQECWAQLAEVMDVGKNSAEYQVLLVLFRVEFAVFESVVFAHGFCAWFLRMVFAHGFCAFSYDR